MIHQILPIRCVRKKPVAFTFTLLNPGPVYAGLLSARAFPINVTNAINRTSFQIVDNFSLVSGPHSLKFGTNMRFQRHTDTRGSVSGINVTPYVNFDTGINTVDPATFGIPGDINTSFDRPVLQRSINFLLGRVG